MYTFRYDAARSKVAARVSILLERGGRLQDRFKLTGGRPKSRRDRRDYNQFRAVCISIDSIDFEKICDSIERISKTFFKDVFIIEEEWTRLDKCYNRGIGPKLATMLWGWLQLPLGLGR